MAIGGRGLVFVATNCHALIGVFDDPQRLKPGDGPAALAALFSRVEAHLLAGPVLARHWPQA